MVIRHLAAAERSWLSNQTQPDLILITEDGGRVPAHCALLAGSSPLFAQLIAEHSPCSGCREPLLIQVAGFTKQDCKAVISLLYTGFFFMEGTNEETIASLIVTLDLNIHSGLTIGKGRGNLPLTKGKEIISVAAVGASTSGTATKTNAATTKTNAATTKTNAAAVATKANAATTKSSGAAATRSSQSRKSLPASQPVSAVKRPGPAQDSGRRSDASANKRARLSDSAGKPDTAASRVDGGAGKLRLIPEAATGRMEPRTEGAARKRREVNGGAAVQEAQVLVPETVLECVLDQKPIKQELDEDTARIFQELPYTEMEDKETNQPQLQDYLGLENTDLSARCKVCQQGFLNSRALAHHQLNCLGTRCKICNQEFSLIKTHYLLNHFKRGIISNFLDGKASSNRCPFCPNTAKTFKTLNLLVLHIGLQHNILEKLLEEDKAATPSLPGSKKKKLAVMAKKMSGKQPALVPKKSNTDTNSEKDKVPSPRERVVYESKTSRNIMVFSMGKSRTDSPTGRGAAADSAAAPAVATRRSLAATPAAAAAPPPSKTLVEVGRASRPRADAKSNNKENTQVTGSGGGRGPPPPAAAAAAAIRVKPEVAVVSPQAATSRRSEASPATSASSVVARGRRVACGVCVKCRMPDCGECRMCLSDKHRGGKTANGTPNSSTSTCVKKVCRDKVMVDEENGKKTGP